MPRRGVLSLWILNGVQGFFRLNTGARLDASGCLLPMRILIIRPALRTVQRFGQDTACCLHPADWISTCRGRGSRVWFPPSPGPQPSSNWPTLTNFLWEIRSWGPAPPGHTPGHGIFYSAAAQSGRGGDVILAGGGGRTDLPGGSWQQLRKSILSQVFTLPPETRIFCGHGKETSVGVEQDTNPFF
jgi:hypothetical protein